MKQETQTKEITVQELRQKGYKVDIVHLRKTKGKRPKLVLKYEIERDLINPKGGATIARITPPKGNTVEARVNVFYSDPYNKKIGAAEAIKKALENLK